MCLDQPCSPHAVMRGPTWPATCITQVYYPKLHSCAVLDCAGVPVHTVTYSVLCIPEYKSQKVSRQAPKHAQALSLSVSPCPSVAVHTASLCTGFAACLPAAGSEDTHGAPDLSSPRSHSSVDSRSSMASVATAPPSLPSFHHAANVPLRSVPWPLDTHARSPLSMCMFCLCCPELKDTRRSFSGCSPG